MEAQIDYSFIDKCLEKRICFAAYSQPNQTEFSIVLQRAAYPLKFNPTDAFTNHKGFLMAPFDSSHSDKLLIQKDFFLREYESSVEAWNFVQNLKPNKKYKSDLPLSTPDEIYFKQFHNFISYLNRRRAKKLVLSRIINTYKNPNRSYSDLFKLLNSKHPTAFNYIFYTPNSGLWLGASPEQLLRIEGEEAYTSALAGTQEIQQDTPLSKYVWGEKEEQEQQFVVNYIERLLKKYLGDEKPKKHTRSIRAAKAVHLETTYKFQAFKISLKLSEFIEELHPTPAVCGLPKSAALKLIRETEHHDREFYSGFLGPINIEKKTDLFVNLRCLKANDQNLSLYVGGGITPDSEAQSEWNETVLKSQTLISLIN